MIAEADAEEGRAPAAAAAPAQAAEVKAEPVDLSDAKVDAIAEPPPAKPQTGNRAFELLQRAREESAKRHAEVAAKRAAAAPPVQQTPPPAKPANAMAALEAGGFSIDDLIRDTIAASDQAAADKGKPAPAIDPEKLIAKIQERVPQLVEQRVQQVFEQIQRAQVEAQEQQRALEMHAAVHEHVASFAEKLPALAAAAKRNAVAVTEAMVSVYDSVLNATGKKLTIDQAARRLNAILAGDDEAIVSAAAQSPGPRSTSAAKPSSAKPSPVDRRDLSFAEEQALAHQEALDILSGKIPVPK